MSEEIDSSIWPIIYVRGYAMSRDEINETTADPFCGFNIGSTVYRARVERDKPPRKFVFESPVLRLATDFNYQDVYENGFDILDPEWPDPALDSSKASIPRASIVICRYYDLASTLLGMGKTPSMEEFAEFLRTLILRVRELTVRNPDNKVSTDDFRCYLVAHSMGGLVCRALLQNPAPVFKDASRHVDKFFTYATPHNGIEVLGANVPEWLSLNSISNFNRDRIAQYLHLGALYDGKEKKRVDLLPESAFDIDRVFCLIGTNRNDYEVAAGASRTFVGQGSDGLVKIDNASLWGCDASGAMTRPAARAYSYRSHSGAFGIVNSEEGYQNLVRFLFGDLRVDIWLDVEAVRLPSDLQAKVTGGDTVDALYQIELTASPRGKRWFMTRRTSEEDSVACRTHAELSSKTDPSKRTIHLSTMFLARKWRTNPKKASLAYKVGLGVRTPDYELEKKFWPNGHYEGGYLFNDEVVVEVTPPSGKSDRWSLAYDWQSDAVGQATSELPFEKLEKGTIEAVVPFAARGPKQEKKSPGIDGQLRFVISRWNND